MSAQCIPNTKLRTGMIVMRKRRDGRLIHDVHLREVFRTSPQFPYLAFRDGSRIVVFAPCGRSWITYS